MSGFTRRYGYFPGTDTLGLIEGVVIVDMPPPSSIQGSGVGTVAIVGEFSDLTYATAVSTAGAVSSSMRPTGVTSSQDMQDKFGEFDSTIGQFGGDGGNGYVAAYGKKFAGQLVLVPINLASSYACRLYRQLPPPKSATDTTPIVPMQAGLVAAGREFKSGANVLRLGKRVVFSEAAEIAKGADGSIALAGTTFTSVTGGFVAKGVKEGDAIVFGIPGIDAGAGTYRVVSVDSATQLTLQTQAGAPCNWAGNDTLLPYRVHPGACADTGGEHQLTEAAGYTLPVRPTAQTVAAATELPPTVVPPSVSASQWDVLSGLKLMTHPTEPIVYDVNVQAANAANHASLDALYAIALNALISEALPAREVNILCAARSSDTIRSQLRANVLSASGSGKGRCAVISPEVDNVTLATEIGDASPGVGAYRDERVFFAWPGAQVFVPAAAGTAIATAAGGTTTDGYLDVPADTWLASVLSVLPPERNPGQAASPVPELLAQVADMQRGLPSNPPLGMNDYILLRQYGVCALRMDASTGPVFQSGITSSLTAGQKNINRRRMADYIQDSLGVGLQKFSKLPLTQALKDSAYAEVDAFLDQLKSENNPAAQRINGYLIDDKSGNTDSTEAAGQHVIITRVRLTPTADVIVVQSEVGENVIVTAQ